jgi:serine/threonine-protein kinase
MTGGSLDARTDVFQVGVVLYEMLTGRPLFGGESRLLRLSAAMTAPDVTALDAVVPTAIANIVRRATVKRTNERYVASLCIHGRACARARVGRLQPDATGDRPPT